jgi:3'(2'), 5'-bisphosphate nucleotidase
MNKLLDIAIIASIKAGLEILKVYSTDFDVEYKEDESPLTIADKNANKIIVSYLNNTGIPVLSEEGRSIPYGERKNWKKLWIVDPLDGTKEFVKRNGEFTVNIALIKNNQPVMGIVYTPVPDILYFGDKNLGAFRLENASALINSFEDILISATKLPQNIQTSTYKIVASRSHLTQETKDFVEKIKEKHQHTEIVTRGSSLKICMIAEGSADIYPRFAPTMEWDTAAGHAIVLASGGRIVQAEKPEHELVYNKENLLNPWFIVKR